MALLVSSGVPRPPNWTDDDRGQMARHAAVGAWVAILGGVQDQHLHAAVLRWLASPDARWWPLPGAVRTLALQLAPMEQRQIAGPVERSAYNELDDWSRQQIIDQADREGWWSLEVGECWRRIEAAAERRQADATPPVIVPVTRVGLR